MKVKRVPYFPGKFKGQVAISNIATGVIYVDQKKLLALPEQERKFIIAHEVGHIKLGTVNEFAADGFAFAYFNKCEPGIHKSQVASLIRLLKDTDYYNLRTSLIQRNALITELKNNNKMIEGFRTQMQDQLKEFNDMILGLNLVKDKVNAQELSEKTELTKAQANEIAEAVNDFNVTNLDELLKSMDSSVKETRHKIKDLYDQAISEGIEEAELNEILEPYNELLQFGSSPNPETCAPEVKVISVPHIIIALLVSFVTWNVLKLIFNQKK